MSEETARRFHEAYERLAPNFGYATRAETREFDPNSANGRLMIAVCDEVVDSEFNRLRAKNERLAKENTKLTDVLLSKHGGEPLALLDELDQARADNEALLNLLAVIHRDGGHYTGKHGVIKSADDAATVVITLRLLLAEACEWSACPNEESEYGFRHCCNTADWEPHIDGCRFHAALGERR